MEKQKNLEAFILDFDGTIVDLAIGWKNIRSRVKEYLSEYGINTALDPLYQEIYNSLEVLRRKNIDEEPIKDKIFSIIEEEERNAIPNSVLIKGARDFLIFLRRNEFKVAILSNNSRKLVENLFLKFDLSTPDAIVGSEDVKNLKPHPEGAEIIIKKLKLDPGNCGFIGDRDEDIRVGKALGLYTILIGASRKNYVTKPDLSAASFKEILKWLKSQMT